MMGPMYENVNNTDFRMYFHNTLVYQANPGGQGYMHVLSVEPDDPLGLAHDAEHRLTPICGPGVVPGTDQHHAVLGRELFQSPNYLMHRWPAEYVPLGPCSFLRVSFEPRTRCPTKGMPYGGHVLLSPLDEAEQRKVPAAQSRAIKKATRNAVRNPYLAIALGMCDVLDMGHPRPVARLHYPGDASVTSKRRTRDLLEGDVATVFVPDFTTCLVKITAVKKPYAVVLYRGIVLGTVRLVQDRLVFTGRDNPAMPGEEDGPAQTLYRSAVTTVARKLCADRVLWPRKRSLAPSAKPPVTNEE